MAEKAFPRDKFDARGEFVIQRPMSWSGRELTPGSLFDKTLVTIRKLRQLYENRYLRIATAEDTPPPPITKHARVELRPRVAPRMMTQKGSDNGPRQSQPTTA